METPLVTVIVPVYNVRPYLDDCLNSLQKQNYPKLEIIIIDDGSTDGSGVFCDEFAKKDPRMRVYHQQNQGLSAARNAGVKLAQGEYISFVDSDDYIAPDYIQYLVSLNIKYQSKLSICAVEEITKKGHTVSFGTGYSEKSMSTEEAIGRMLREEGFNVSAYAKLYYRELWQDVFFPEGAVHEDLGTTYKLLEKCTRVAYGPEAKYTYRKRTDSISTAGFSNQKLDIIKLTDEMCDNLEGNFPYLILTIRLRRMHARFSVLRQMLTASKLGAAEKQQEINIIKYLKQNRKFITKNPYATLRDKVAIYTLLICPPMFKIAWQIYSLFRK